MTITSLIITLNIQSYSKVEEALYYYVSRILSFFLHLLFFEEEEEISLKNHTHLIGERNEWPLFENRKRMTENQNQLLEKEIICPEEFIEESDKMTDYKKFQENLYKENTLLRINEKETLLIILSILAYLYWYY